MVRADTTLQDYLASAYVPGRLDLSAGWIEQLGVAVSRLDAWHGVAVRLSDLSTELLRRFLRDYRQQVSATTTNAKRRGILAIWRFAYEEGDLPEPPGKIPLCREVHELPQAWTVDEVERIIAVARTLSGTVAGIPAGRWFSSILLALYDSGSRIGAMMAVGSGDLSLPDRSLVLRAETTKARRPQYCRLSDQTVAAVAAIYDPGRKYVWPWPHQRKTLYRRARKLFAAAGVPHGKGNGGLFARMRKTSGSLVAANGGNAQLHLGHSSAATTSRHYLDPRIVGGGQLDYLPRPGQPTTNGCRAWNLD